MLRNTLKLKKKKVHYLNKSRRYDRVVAHIGDSEEDATAAKDAAVRCILCAENGWFTSETVQEQKCGDMIDVVVDGSDSAKVSVLKRTDADQDGSKRLSNGNTRGDPVLFKGVENDPKFGGGSSSISNPESCKS